MSCPPDSDTIEVGAKPHSEISAFIVERHYAAMGCDRWNSRSVRVLMAKLNDTAPIFAARLRIRPMDLQRRFETDCWTRQDGLILTMIEREIDFLKGGRVPEGRLVPGGAS